MSKLISKYQAGKVMPEYVSKKPESSATDWYKAINDLFYVDSRSRYLQLLENPDMIGYDAKNDKWTPPKHPKFDKNQIGIGLDTKRNKLVVKYLKDKKRQNSPWLSNTEMLELQDKSLLYLENVIDRRLKGTPISLNKRLMAIGMLYRGDGPTLWDENSKINHVLLNGTDAEMSEAVLKFYKDKNLTERVKNHKKFFDE